MVRFEFEEEDLQKYLDMMYEGFGSKPKDKKSDLEAVWQKPGKVSGTRLVSVEQNRWRMARNAIIQNANRLRKERGEKADLGVKGLDLDEDD